MLLLKEKCNVPLCKQARLLPFLVKECPLDIAIDIFCDEDGSKQFNKAYKCPACRYLTANIILKKPDNSPVLSSSILILSLIYILLTFFR